MPLRNPAAHSPLLPLISTWGQYAVGLDARLNNAGGPASSTWAATRRVAYVPIFLPVACVTAKFWWFNGAAVSGNVDCGIYTSVNGAPNTRIARTGSTAQSGTNTMQSVTVVQSLDRGRYYMALSLDNTTGTIFRSTGGNSTLTWKTLGLCEETPGVFGVPASATPVTPSSDRLWLFGFSLGATI